MKFAAVIVFTVLVGVGVAVLVSSPNGGVKQAQAQCGEDEDNCLPAIDMSATDGWLLSADEMKGNVVVVNFWATWCKPCRIETPDFAEVYTKYKGQGLKMIGVVTDQPSQARLADFSASTGLNYPVVYWDMSLAEHWDYPNRIPRTFVYDRSGHLVKVLRGGVTKDELGGLVEELLAQKVAPPTRR